VALLAKWKWRYAIENISLWRSTLESKFGDWRELNQSNQPKHESVWWKDLKKKTCGVGVGQT